MSNIPTLIYVHHVPDDYDGCPSVAQSHHTKNLKRSERYEANSGGIIDCCGGGGALKNVNHNHHYDYDTIETDDYTIDYTLNTIDDSRLDYLRVRSKQTTSMQDYHGDDDERRQDRDVPRDAPNSSILRCLGACFGCGGGDDDAYTMASQRGITVQQQQQRVTQYQEVRQREPPAGTGKQPRPDSGHFLPNPSADADSEFGSMCRVGEDIPKPPKRQNNALYPKYSIDESDYSNNRVGGGIPEPPKIKRQPNIPLYPKYSMDDSDYSSIPRPPKVISSTRTVSYTHLRAHET